MLELEQEAGNNMYGYSQYAQLTAENILLRASQEEIFNLVIPDEIKKGAFYKAPYRNDNSPKCYFEEYNGVLWFMDFADIEGRHAKDCFNIISRTLNVNYLDALNYINNKLDLGLGDSSVVAKEIKYQLKNPVEEHFLREKIIRPITYVPRLFNGKDKQFWSKYEISKQNLIDDKVIPISMYRSYSRKKDEFFTVKPLDIAYAYTEFEEDKVKIYRPFASKESKFFTNCGSQDIGSIDHLPLSGNTLIISKSYKDCRVLRNQGLNCVWIQGEGMMPSGGIITMLGKRFDKIIVWFDNDQTGLAKGLILRDFINSIFPGKASTIFLPPIMLNNGIKDPSDLIAKEGRVKLTNFLKEKNLINEP